MLMLLIGLALTLAAVALIYVLKPIGDEPSTRNVKIDMILIMTCCFGLIAGMALVAIGLIGT